MQKDFSNVLLISDLDDTLLTKSKEITQKDRASIDEFISKGGSFSVATGRVYESAMPYIKKLNITHPCIMYNGGMIFNTKNEEVLWKCTLPANAKDYVVEVLDAFPEVAAEILIGKEIYVPKFNKILENKMVMERVNCITCTMGDIPDNWIKVLFTLDHDLIPKVAKFIESRNFEGVSFVESCGCYYEMLPQGVSKGTAIKVMLELTNNENMKIVTVGDYNNDIEMIKMADIGACVSSSPDEVKEIADVVLKNTSENNAITELIKYIENNLEV